MAKCLLFVHGVLLGDALRRPLAKSVTKPCPYSGTGIWRAVFFRLGRIAESGNATNLERQRCHLAAREAERLLSLDWDACL